MTFSDQQEGNGSGRELTGVRALEERVPVQLLLGGREQISTGKTL